jgi:tRNA threonylcarbamoyladenosine biosynthesis protein TsaE
MERIGMALAGHLEPGDVVSLDGPLGAGKTTLVRGLARGLGVTDRVSSPTFVIARRHRGSKSDLIHCDAYRIDDEGEFADLGLETEDAVVVLEWGGGYAALVSDDWLGVSIRRSIGSGDETRHLAVRGHGERWNAAEVSRLTATIDRAMEGTTSDPGD